MKLTERISEYDFEKYLMLNMSEIEKGLSFVKKQIKLSSILRDYFTDISCHEDYLNWYKVDIFCLDKNDSPVIIEIKNKKIGLCGYQQLESYVRILNTKKNIFRGILVAPKIIDVCKDAINNHPNLSWKEIPLRKI